MGACILIQVELKRCATQPGFQLHDTTEDMSAHLEMAIEALKVLDNDNRMVARCRDYLEQFVQTVRNLGTGTTIYSLFSD